MTSSREHKEAAARRFMSVPAIVRKADGTVIVPEGETEESITELLTAHRRYQETGDKTELIRLGIFSPEEE